MESKEFTNCYQDQTRAEAYAKLEFAGTYYLAYRDLPAIFAEHVRGKEAIDFGCGTGRSTRFLREHGFHAIGIDISGDMIRKARQLDPGGDYRLIEDGDFSQFRPQSFDLVLAAFTFDNIAGEEKKVQLFQGLGGLLRPQGRIVMVVSSPEIYLHEWASFSTKDFPENRQARSGDVVKIIVTDHEDRRPVEDIVWTDEAYREVFGRAGLAVVENYKPLATAEEPYAWVSETEVAPWVIYVLQAQQ
ncbi:MAG TPA: methyltransferase domain-containing protein [Terriglobales bacterium]|jgi:SAM-dependent methyltransferase|nr:methyltransferase domain-containing protein [Terriglobales bacterium]